MNLPNARKQYLGAGMTRNIQTFLLLTLLSLVAYESTARTVILDCVWGDTPIEQYEQATAIVVATVASVSIKDVGKQFPRRTILWNVKESWKGPHYKGSQFTTQENFYIPTNDWSLTPGKAMLLYLGGREPYEIESPMCGSSGYLEDSILELEELFKLRDEWAKGP